MIEHDCAGKSKKGSCRGQGCGIKIPSPYDSCVRRNAGIRAKKDQSKKKEEQQAEADRQYREKPFYPPCWGRNGQYRCWSYCNNQPKMVGRGVNRCPFPSKKVYDDFKRTRAMEQEAANGPQDCAGKDRNPRRRTKNMRGGRSKVYYISSEYEYCINRNAALAKDAEAEENAQIIDSSAWNEDVRLNDQSTHDQCMQRMKDSPGIRIDGCERFQDQQTLRPKGAQNVECRCNMAFTHWCTASGKAVKHNNPDNRRDCKAEQSNYNNYRGPSSFKQNCGVKFLGVGPRKYEKLIVMLIELVRCTKINVLLLQKQWTIAGSEAMQQKKSLCATTYVHMSKWMSSCSMVKTVGTVIAEGLESKPSRRRRY